MTCVAAGLVMVGWIAHAKDESRLAEVGAVQ